MGKGMHLCSFSCTAANLKKSLRNENGVLYALKHYPLISTFDMSEKPWLRNIIEALEKKGFIKKEKEPYPWHRWSLTAEGEKLV